MTFIWEVIVQAPIAIFLGRVLLQQGSILFLAVVFSFLPRCPLAALAFFEVSLSLPLFLSPTSPPLMESLQHFLDEAQRRANSTLIKIPSSSHFISLPLATRPQ